jgi:hypothetical protein
MPLETLESVVIEGFSSVPNNYLPPDDFKKFANLSFNTSEFKKMYWVKPVKDICEVSASCMKGRYALMRHLSHHVGRVRKELWLFISVILSTVFHDSM